MRQICRKRQSPRWTSRLREQNCANRVCWCLKIHYIYILKKKAVKCSLGEMRKWRYFCLISDLCALHSMGAAPLESLLPQQQSGRVSEVPFISSSSFLWGFCCWMWLCVTVTADAPRSPSPSSQLLWDGEEGWGEMSKPLFVCECGCLCIKEGCPCVHFTHVRSVCASACLCMFCMRLCVFSSLLLHFHLFVCRLPKPEAPVGFWGASGRKRNDWAITLFLLSPQRCSTPPCLVFRPGGLCFGGGGGLLCFTISLSVSW